MQWEYDKLTVKYEMSISDLNRMGYLGWELVAVTHVVGILIILKG